MDGNGALFGTLSGNTRDIIHKVCIIPAIKSRPISDDSSSRLIFQRNMVEEVSRLCVLRVFVRRSVTTMFARSLKLQFSASCKFRTSSND